MVIQKFVWAAKNVVGRFIPKRLVLSVFTGLVTAIVTHTVHAVPAQYPLFLANPVTPIMMLNMSNDHQLYFKLYDDYSNITDEEGGEPDEEGEADTTYVHKYSYYGYFDSDKCYTYNTTTDRFEPSEWAGDDGYCSGKWSGNFLNWATMTRMDAVRKILYGGLRSTDTEGVTVLERAFLPHDAHSFAKFYDGDDIAKLTPFTAAQAPALQGNTEATGITICNTTNGGSSQSQDVTSAPLLRIAKGNYTLWASNERWQCRWDSEISWGDKNADRGENGNDSNLSNIYAYSKSPPNEHKLGSGSAAGEFNARIQVCVDGMLESNCTAYPNENYKPTGLLQKYGEASNGSAAKINFGLMTGSYGKNKSGGVLRKVIGTMNNEINVTTNGTFIDDDDVPGVISTLNKLRIYGYRYGNGNGVYHRNSNSYDSLGSDGCLWSNTTFSNNHCTNWGNPQAEIYLESLRYLAGKTVNPSFNVDDSNRISDLLTADWGSAPVSSDNWCAPLNVVQFNASTTSYDGDDLSSFSDIAGVGTLSSWTDNIGDHEELSGDFFVGSTGAGSDELCTAKSVTSLAAVRGTCPDAPRLEGSYHLAGLAYYARQNDIMSAVQGKQTVRTYGVALAPALPKATIPVPNNPSQQITIIPACRNTSPTPDGNCAIVDFKIVSQTFSSTVNSGILYVNWEDSEQGGDYDQDMWGTIEYEVTSSGEVTITTDVVFESTPFVLGFGYIIDGTTEEGFYVHSGVSGFDDGDCDSCNVGDGPTSKEFEVGTSSASFLEPPLYYASKWGGYSDEFVREELGEPDQYTDAELTALIKGRDISDTYYFVTDPRKLEESLDTAFRSVAAANGSASSVATNSTRLSEGAFVYQAQFNSENWSGTLNSYEFNSNGELGSLASHSTDGASMHSQVSGRTNVYTSIGGSTTLFNWGNLFEEPEEELFYLDGDTAADAQKRVEWILGSKAAEDDATGLRERGDLPDERNILGDIVNSSPAYSGAWDFRYHLLPTAQGGGDAYRTYVKDVKKSRTPLLFVGANDGMVHAFNAETLDDQYSYIPNMVFSKLAALTVPDYGKGSNAHQFLVDGPITVGDVYIGSSWKTIIVGTLGAGGRGVYALDVTNPSQPSMLFELDENDYPQLGYVMGKPLIVPLTNGRWAAVFGNGDSSGTTSQLFVVDIESPYSANTRIYDTVSGTGLSAPAILPNAIGQATVAYAGDLNGNLWKFDLTGSSFSLVFKAEDSGENPQPITAAPTLGINASKDDGVIMVYFGTGKYYDVGDNIVSDTPVHSFYAVADIGEEVTRGTMYPKTLTTNTLSPFSTSTRIVNQDEAGEGPDWSVHNGWYLDFTDTDAERVTTKAILLADKLIFPTLIPSSASCEYGGRSWLMEVVAVGDKFVGQKVLENIIPNDFLVLGDIGFGVTPGGGAIVGSGTDATLFNEDANPPLSAAGRQSWRQLR